MHPRPGQPEGGWASSHAGVGTERPTLDAPQLAVPTLVGPGSDARQARDDTGVMPISRIEQLAAANETLQRDLARFNERLNVVLDLSEQSNLTDDPEATESTLLARFATTLRAGLVVAVPPAAPPRVVADADCGCEIGLDRLTCGLELEIDVVRRTCRARSLTADELLARGLPPLHVLAGALVKDGQPEVLLALRSGQQPAFDRDDELSCETLLIYGGHILRNMLMVQQLQRTSLETVASLANAIEARDAYTGGHSERVGWLAVLTGRALGLPEDELRMLEWAGLLHDIGKIGIPERVLNKPGALTPEEYELIKQHPRLGYEVLRPLSGLKPVLDAVLYHHENHDGSGYPAGLRGDRIPPLARILHVVDIFDALTSTRSYRQGSSVAAALDILQAGAGTITEPVATRVFAETLARHVRADRAAFAERFPHLRGKLP